MDRIAFDESAWPLVQVTIPEVITDEAWDAGIASLRGYLARAQPMAFVTLTGGAPTRVQRLLMAQFMRLHEPELRRYVRAWAVVTKSPLLRGAMAAIAWLKPPPFRERTFSEASAALAWARESLAGEARLS